MTTIIDISEKAIKTIASELNGNVWIKGDKIRIYVTGGNNYHYNGKWYYEIAQDGSWEVKCYLTDGYGNKNREEYVAKYLKEMEDEMENFLFCGNKFGEEHKNLLEEIEVVDVIGKNDVYQGEEINFGDNDYKYPVNFYNGCGSYYLALNADNKIIASVNFTSSMFCKSIKQKSYLAKQIEDKGLQVARIIEADGSGTTFYARNESDVEGFETKVYFIPKAGGGKHKNIELVFG